MNDFVWDEPTVESLKRYMREGLSSSQMASRLGTTRNAVIGKVMRLGIGSSRPVRPDPLAKVRAPAVRKPRPAPLPKVKAPSLPAAESLPVPNADHAAPEFRTLPMMDLTAGDCRFPLWDHRDNPPFEQQLYCGNATPEGKSWCPYHQAIVFTPSVRRA